MIASPVMHSFFALVLSVGILASSRAEAALVTFDFTTEPYEGSSNGVRILTPSGLPPRATFTGQYGREIGIVTFSPGGSVQPYYRDTFGSGPSFAFTFLGDQRSFFGFGDTTGPETVFDFGSPVRLVSATFVLYASSPNLEVRVREAGETTSTTLDYFFSGGPSDPDSLPVLPPETMVTFDNTLPLTDHVTMRSLGQPGAALQTLVIDDPSVSAIPEPSSVLGLAGILGLALCSRRR
jgi:hypothetical protein